MTRAVAEFNFYLSRLRSLEEIQEGRGRRIIRTVLQQHRILGNHRIQLTRHKPAGATVPLGDLGQCDKTQFRIAGSDKLIGLAMLLP